MTTMQVHCLVKACLQFSKAETGMVWVMMRAILIGCLPETLLVERGRVVYPSLVPGPVRQHH